MNLLELQKAIEKYINLCQAKSIDPAAVEVSMMDYRPVYLVPDISGNSALYVATESEKEYDEWWDAWEDKYKPLVNTIDQNASFDGKMFETFGLELEYVCKQPTNRVWTYTDCDGVGYLQAGYHLVNRMGYFITEVPFDEANPPADFPFSRSGTEDEQEEI